MLLCSMLPFDGEKSFVVVAVCDEFERCRVESRVIL